MLKVLFHPLAPFLITALVLALWASFFMTMREIRQSSNEVSSLQQQVQANQKKVLSLQAELQNAQSPVTQESVIRNELLMQKPGEYIVQLPTLPSPSPSPTSELITPTPWQEWQKLLKL